MAGNALSQLIDARWGDTEILVVDLPPGTGDVQLTMLQRLSKLYGVPYSENLGKAAVISLASSIGGPGAALTIAASMVKIVPFFGTLAGGLSVPATFGAFTFAVGKVFTQHFESGGTFLDFRASAYRDYFREMFGRGKAVLQEEKAAQDVQTGNAHCRPPRASSGGFGNWRIWINEQNTGQGNAWC